MSINDMIYFYPTDTVWGMGGNITSESAQKWINLIKQSDPQKPLSVLFTSQKKLEQTIKFEQLGISNYRDLFSYELTIGIPLKYTDYSIPTYIYKNSNMLFFRFLPQLEGLLPEVLTSTSVNLSHEEPINNLSEVQQFVNRSHIINSDLQMKIITTDQVMPSGNSSTIIVLDGQKRKVVRQGKHYNELRKLCGL